MPVGLPYSAMAASASGANTSFAYFCTWVAKNWQDASLGKGTNTGVLGHPGTASAVGYLRMTAPSVRVGPSLVSVVCTLRPFKTACCAKGSPTNFAKA